MNVTRDVISDLWPIYEAGEATPDTRTLVDAFLAREPDFAAALRARLIFPAVQVPVSPDDETRALCRTRDLVRGRSWLRVVRTVAAVMTAFAVMHVVEDTNWTTSPRLFIADALIAAVLWTTYFVVLAYQRRKALS